MKEYIIAKGESKTIYKHINASGYLKLRIANKSNSNKIKYWWTIGPFGSNKRSGYLKNIELIKIEGFLWGKLKVAEADSDTIIHLTDNPETGIKFPKLNW